MVSLGAPGSDLLAGADRERFSSRFQQDLEFFRLLLLLFNKACPVRNLDLVWSERDPSGAFRVRHLGTTEALSAPWSGLLGVQCANPHPEFCNLINDWGRREAESCAVSDAAAEEVVKRTGRPYVYECRFGLTDIAVPVIVNGQHIATLFTGQVLRRPPSERKFARIAKAASRVGYVDLDRLAQAYWKLPVVSNEDIRTTVQIVEAFAEWLARSWSRIREVVGEERRKQREMDLARKEVAYLALESLPRDTIEVRRLMGRLGIHRPLNRVLVVKLQARDGSGSFEEELLHEVQLTSALQAVEDACEAHGNATFAALPSGEICVFFHDPPQRGLASGDAYARALANRLHHGIRERCRARVRIGIGDRQEGWRVLKESYREACAALIGSDEDIVCYRPLETPLGEPYRTALEISRLLAAGNLGEAREQAASLAAWIVRSQESERDLGSLRLFLTSTLQTIGLTARERGCQASAVDRIQKNALAAFGRASGVREMVAAWRKWFAALIEEAALLQSGKRKKIAVRACQLVMERLESGDDLHELCAKTVAAEMGVSRSHFSRIFKQETGQTFASYLTAKRMELAQRLLLDPAYNVSQVAERCGYKDTSYLAKVFRRFLGCSPMEFCRDPSAALQRRSGRAAATTGESSVTSPCGLGADAFGQRESGTRNCD